MAGIEAAVGGGKVKTEDLDRLSRYLSPMWDEVLILPSEDPKTVKLAGGLELSIPEAAKNLHPTEGVVILTGPQVDQLPRIDDDGQVVKDADGKEIMEPIFQPGDRVIFSKYAGFKTNFPDGTSLLLLPQRDIRAIMDPDCPVLEKERKPEFVPR